MSFILIVGAGRVGSTVARTMLANGHEVSVLDEDPLSHERLDSGMDTTWEDAGGRFTVGHGLEIDALREAGIEEADVFIASTDGDNTNLVIAQIARQALRGAARDLSRHGPRAGRVVRRAGPAHHLPDELRDRDVRARARGGLGTHVRRHRRRRQGRLEPRPRAHGQGPRGHRHRERPLAATSPSSRSSSTPSSTATRPSSGSSSARASTAPT